MTDRSKTALILGMSIINYVQPIGDESCLGIQSPCFKISALRETQ